MPTYRTPDVYIEEIAVFPPSVAEVETAVPAFIGYTETAPERVADGENAPPRPRRITSFVDFERAFGKPQAASMTVALADDGQGGFDYGLSCGASSRSLLAHRLSSTRNIIHLARLARLFCKPVRAMGSVRLRAASVSRACLRAWRRKCVFHDRPASVTVCDALLPHVLASLSRR